MSIKFRSLIVGLLAVFALLTVIGHDPGRCAGERKAGEVCLLEYGTDADAFRRAYNNVPVGGTLIIPAGSYMLQKEQMLR